MVDKSTLHLADALASSIYSSTDAHMVYFTLQRAQLQHTVDVSISAEQIQACNVRYDRRAGRGRDHYGLLFH